MDPRPGRHNRLNIRKRHPGLYHSIMTLGIMGVALAFNFWFSTPTFNPYDIPKDLIGVIWFLLGMSQLIFLNVFRNLRAVRIVLAISISFMFFWGASNAQQFFNGKASLQLPILYMTIAILQIPLLVESPINPMTERD